MAIKIKITLIIFLIINIFSCDMFCINSWNYTDELLNIYSKIYNEETSIDEKRSLIPIYIDSLKEYLKSNKNIKKTLQEQNIAVVSKYFNNHTFNLIRYDANPEMFGTLERTWTLLQIISENNIEVYTLHEKSGQFPLYIKIMDLPNKNQILAVGGVTNVLRHNTAFVSLWEYGQDGLKEFTDISIENPNENISIFDNRCYFEYFNDDKFKIIESNYDSVLYEIIGTNFNIYVELDGDRIVVK